MGHIAIGRATAEWDEGAHFIFTIQELRGSKDSKELESIKVDLTKLQTRCTEDFLINLRDILIRRRNRVTLRTIETEASNIKSLLMKVNEAEGLTTLIGKIDDGLLIALTTIVDTVSGASLRTLKRFFENHPEHRLFASNLRGEDFPVKTEKRGAHGANIDRVLSKSLTRIACVEFLHRLNEAYEQGTIDIARFAFGNLAFAIYVRPESYRNIKVSDLTFDTSSGKFYVHVLSAKLGSEHAVRIPFALTDEVGLILRKQQISVISEYGPLLLPAQNPLENEQQYKTNHSDAISKAIKDLPMFPALSKSADGSKWRYDETNASRGKLAAHSFYGTYYKPLQRLAKGFQGKLNANNLRHTIGTNLALSGCSAKTIAAVLKHATERTCRKYVDIAFKGLIDVLSDAMQPAFDEHMPAYTLFKSVVDPIDSSKAIHSDDIETGRDGLTGECGKMIRCEHAPLACYGCNRFIPCYDADHTINLTVAQREYDRYKDAGRQYHKLKSKAEWLLHRIQVVVQACSIYKQGAKDLAAQ